MANSEVSDWIRQQAGRGSPTAEASTAPTMAELAIAADVAATMGITEAEALAKLRAGPVPVPRGDAGAGTGGSMPVIRDGPEWLRTALYLIRGRRQTNGYHTW